MAPKPAADAQRLQSGAATNETMGAHWAVCMIDDALQQTANYSTIRSDGIRTMDDGRLWYTVAETTIGKQHAS